MHELSVCQALLDQVRDVARSHAAESVEMVAVRIGPLSGIVPELLEHAFSIARAGDYTAGSRLEIETLPVRIHCSNCNLAVETAPNRLVCPECGNWRVDLVSGDEMLLARVELRHPSDRPAESSNANQSNEVSHV